MDKEMQTRFEKAKVSLDAFADSESADTVAREKINALREALKFVLSRPDRDNLSIKLIPIVKNPLMHLKIYDETLFSLTQEAISTYKNKEMPVIYRATALFMIENSLAEARPQMKTSTYMRQTIESIRDADLDVDSDVQKFRSRNGMFSSRNPSKIAKVLLKSK